MFPDGTRAELDDPLDPRTVGKREGELARLFVPLGPDADHRAVALAVEEPPGIVDEPEAAVPAHTADRDVDGVRVDEPEGLDRRDGYAGDASHQPQATVT